MNIEEGIIHPSNDSPIGFTVDAWTSDSYLWREGDRILVSLVFAKKPGEGSLNALFKAINAAGFKIAVPTPLGQMEQILKHKGFTRTAEDSGFCGLVDVWIQP